MADGFIKTLTIDHGLITVAPVATRIGFADIIDITDNRLLGRSAGSAGIVQEITIGSGLSLAAGTLSATGSGYSDEQAQDAVAAAIAAGTHTAITITYDDIANSLSLANTDRGSVAVATHEALPDPHPQYLTATEGNAAYQPLDADLTAIAALTTTGIVVRTGTNTYATRTLQAGTGISITNPAGIAGDPTITCTVSGTGTVTSVAITGPSIITWSGSPITTGGTLTGSLANQNANLVLAGPTSGGAATPAFRGLVVADLPLFNGLTSATPALDDLLAGYDTTAGADAQFTIAAVARLAFSATEPGGRLALQSANPLPLVIAASAFLYYTPFKGQICLLYDGSQVIACTVPEIEITLASLSSNNCYDVFLFTSSAVPSSTDTSTNILTFSPATGWASGSVVRANVSGGGLTAGTDYWYRAATSTTGTLHTSLGGAIGNTGIVDITASITATLTAISLETLVWTNRTTRATAVTIGVDGWFIKSGDRTRRLLGTFYTAGTGGPSISTHSVELFNLYNRLAVGLSATETTGSWTYNSAAFRESRGGLGGGLGVTRLGIVQGISDMPVIATAKSLAGISTAATVGFYSTGVGIDNATNVALPHGQGADYISAKSDVASYVGNPGVGYRQLWWLEAADGQGANFGWFGMLAYGGTTQIRMGINARVMV